MKDVTWIRLPLPRDFSCKVDRMLVDMRERGIRKTKADKIMELAQIGYWEEKQQDSYLIDKEE